MVPVFEYVPVFAPQGAQASLSSITLQGVSTIHGDTNTDRGRLYGAVTGSGPGPWTLSLYADRAQTVLICSGTVATLGAYFALTAAAGKPISGQAQITSYLANESRFVVVPTFATDPDVMMALTDCQALPGWDAVLGLAMFHAEAMRQLLTLSLPRLLPYLYRTDASGASSFIPNVGVAVPDLSKVANIDALRLAQGALVKALSCEQSEQLEEFAAIAKLARTRLDELLTALQESNKVEDVAADQFKTNNATVSFGSFRRG